LESANVVGYANTDTQEGGLTIGAQFVPVSGGTFDLTDLKVTGYDPEVGTEADVQVQTLDEYGRTVKNYAFYDIPGDFFGWFDDDEAEAAGENDVTILPGQGLWTMSSSDGFTFVFPGVTL
jgi:hypothetical protein